ncbi:molybdopterin-dependent oxidoreductase [Rhizobium jaguaris]|uniref:xanthine dehydrogenase family protein molybdopterin-binding subunit n=1 Tax=Rhizobium jaguaris TaxID=1312183 RepID=UPI0039BF79D6
MDTLDKAEITRRGLLTGTGFLVVSFSVSRALGQEAAPVTQTTATPPLPGSLADDPYLDSWIKIDAGNHIIVFTGKAELGQGVETALLQLAADELEVEPGDIELITADTDLTPNEGYTAGSQSMMNSGTAIRNAAAQVRDLLIAQAAGRFGVEASTLQAKGKRILASDGRSVAYGELVSGQALHLKAQPQSKLTPPSALRYIGKPMQRVDIPGKVTGGVSYVQDLKLDGMLHARVVRPPSYGAKLLDFDQASIASIPGIVSIIRDGNYLAVVAEQEFQAIKAMQALTASAKWEEKPSLPEQANLAAALESLEREVGTVAQSGAPTFNGPAIFEATYTRPYTSHGSIGPSCSVAVMDKDGNVKVWTHTQGVYPDRGAIADLLGLPKDKVRAIHMQGSGCYGHNGADDAAGDAAFIASKLPGRPIRVQWMREQEHGWEPFGPAMVTKVKASLDASGKIDNWTYDLWSNTHSTRPGKAGELLAGRLKENPVAPLPVKMEITPAGNGDRNADPLYVIPNRRILWHFVAEMPVRVSALRGLGAYANVFSIESTMDELSRIAKADPVEFRLRHLADPRARDVVQMAADKFGWSNSKLPDGHGRGFAFARYKNHAAYLAIAVEAKVERETGRAQVLRAVAAIDSGQVINPDGIRNQTEGGILQSMSWTLYEAVTFDDTRITSTDWSRYPILRFASVPETLDVHIIDRPDQPFLGTGEAAQGPTSAAVSNAIRDAIGKRLYNLPLTRERIKAAMAV